MTTKYTTPGPRSPRPAESALGLRLGVALTCLTGLALTAAPARACDWCHLGKRVYVVAAEPTQRVATVEEPEVRTVEVRTVVVRRVRRVAAPANEPETREATASPQSRAPTLPAKQLPRAAVPAKELPRAAVPAKELPRAALPAKELPKPVPPAKEQPRAAAPSKQAPRAAVAPSRQAPRAAAQAPSREADVVEEEYVEEEEVPTRVARLVPAERVLLVRVKKHHARGTVYVLCND